MPNVKLLKCLFRIKVLECRTMSLLISYRGLAIDYVSLYSLKQSLLEVGARVSSMRNKVARMVPLIITH